MRYGAVMSVDGRGVVTLHLPEAGAQAVAPSAKGPVQRPHGGALEALPLPSPRSVISFTVCREAR
jgi:hypothetical protein